MSGETTEYEYQGEWGRPPSTTIRVSGVRPPSTTTRMSGETTEYEYQGEWGLTTEYDYQGEWGDHRVRLPG